MMDKIGRSVEADPVYSARIHFTETPAEATTADALSESAAQIVRILEARAMACYTSSGSTARRIARERAQVPTLAMTASMKVARRLGLQWGVHAVHTRDVNNFEEMVGKAKRMVLRHHLAEAGDRVLIMAGVPFKTAGSTNVIHVVRIVGDELDNYSNEGLSLRQQRGDLAGNFARQEADRPDLLRPARRRPRRAARRPTAAR